MVKVDDDSAPKKRLPWEPLMRLSCALLTLLLLVGCSESARDSLAGARLALSESRYDDALSTADAGLALGGDDATIWGLELVKLEALARSGRGDDVVLQIQKLAGERPQNVRASQYSATADQLRTADQGGAAIQVLDLGLKRFPEDASLASLIEEARKAPTAGSEELEMLRSLGYVE
jgi:hypothetical protein